MCPRHREGRGHDENERGAGVGTSAESHRGLVARAEGAAKGGGKAKAGKGGREISSHRLTTKQGGDGMTAMVRARSSLDYGDLGDNASRHLPRSGIHPAASDQRIPSCLDVAPST